VYEDKLWKEFSLFIRLRDSDADGFGNCITCKKKVHYKESHAGHFISRRHKATKFDEKNVHLQCVSCNTYNAGRQYEYSIELDRRYGEGTAEELLQKSNELKKFTKSEIDELTKEYKEKVKQLKNKKNIA
jgi:hypothetical protein